MSNGFVQPHVESWPQQISGSCRLHGDAHMVHHHLPDAVDDSRPGGGALAASIPASVIFWGIAAVTLAFAWLARYDTSRGYSVLAVSLLAVTLFFSPFPERRGTGDLTGPGRARRPPAAAHGCDRPVCGMWSAASFVRASFLDPKPSRIVPFRVLVPSLQRDGRVHKILMAQAVPGT